MVLRMALAIAVRGHEITPPIFERRDACGKQTQDIVLH
jgi:hypothetical protein